MSDLKDRVKAKATGEEPQAPSTDVDIAAHDKTLAWLERRRTYIASALPRHVDEGHFIQTALTAMDKLRNCSVESIEVALLECARFGLAPDGRNAAIVPYKGNATFQPMYQGLIDVMHRSGVVSSVHFGWIRERDLWDHTPTAPSPHDFVHKPDPLLTSAQRGPVILAYAFCWMRDGRRSQVILLNRSEAEEIRDTYSQAYRYAESTGKRDSPWHTDFDAMWAKSAVRRLGKRVPTSPEMVDLLRADDEADQELSVPSVIRAVPVTDEETGGQDDAGAEQ
ncbi:recombinase RecT [Streptomyces sp. DH37]|uniref:recombinase RecT n=1 Tax=Streptomyces sp. DH37 TaxID=3040122 RepID=UPI00244321E4|nr:recombinase RecT [Streptomyces sp. DH37]MDG9703736.1 recombinase RecT [Streptomyces sp. DH37]